jgi:ethanolamine transporter
MFQKGENEMMLEDRFFEQEWVQELSNESFRMLLYLLHYASKKTGIIELNMRQINFAANTGRMFTIDDILSEFGNMIKMDKKGALLNSAFAVSGAFTFAGHLAFTLAYDADYLPAMIVGKLVAGVLAVVVGLFLYKRNYKEA